ncbi:MAG: hypothetical protein A2014_01640 [Spirochaetes bacterium GWF1_49_6]|nr:MAG: hypothetical protein A2014_01640 [Spirochaetes bacterium GWF1_49_6]
MKSIKYLLIMTAVILTSCQNTIKVKNKEYVGDNVNTKVVGFGKEQQVATINAQSDINILMSGAAYIFTQGKAKISDIADCPTPGKADGYFNSIQKTISDKLYLYEFKEISGSVFLLSGKRFIQKSEMVMADPNLRVFPSVIMDALDKQYKSLAKNQKASGAAYIRKVSYSISDKGKITIQYEVLIVEDHVE